MKFIEKWKPDFVVATLAVIIGLTTMFVYIYQARIMSKQLHASVWPYIEVISSQGPSGISIDITNKGVGPAIIKKYRIIIDGKEFKEDRIDSLLIKLVGRKLNRNLTTIESRVLSAGDKINFILITDLRDMVSLDSAMRKHPFSLEVCYSSIYDDCWQVKNGKNESCNACQ